VPLPPAFVVLVSAVAGLAVLGGRRQRKRGKSPLEKSPLELRTGSVDGWGSRFVP
jgi:hypothetical protein